VCASLSKLFTLLKGGGVPAPTHVGTQDFSLWK
jgi:hypothetical protein